MKKIKTLGNLTIKEFEEYKIALQDDNFSRVCDLFELDINELTVEEYNEFISNLTMDKIQDIPIKEVYNINGRLFKTVSMIKDLKAGQFIDFQSSIGIGRIESILSIFLIPYDKPKLFKKSKLVKYNTGYDILEVQDYLFNNMTMSDVNALSTFFLTLSLKLLPRIQISLMQKMKKMKKEEIK